jgi:hypothetical protein
MIIRSLLLSVFVVITFGAFAQTYLESSKGSNGKFGFINNEGEWAIQPKYDEVSEFNEGQPFAFAKLKGKWGLIDTLDNAVLPFEFSRLIYEVFYFDSDNYVGVVKNKKYGVVNQTTGKFFLECVYDAPFEFTDGIIPALGNLSVVYRNGKSGLINEKGREIVPCVYDNVKNPFKDLYLDIYATAQQNNKIGVIDTLGQLVVPCVYDEIKSNEDLESLDVIRKKKHGVFSLLEKKETVAPLYDNTIYFEGDYAIVSINKKYGAIDKQGKVVVPINFDDYGDVIEKVELMQANQ